MLKLNHSLLDPNFEGYKVSMENFPIFKKNLEEKCFSRNRPNSMVTLQHMKIFGEENPIFSNFEAKKLYRFLENGDVQMILFDRILKTFQTSIIAHINLGSPDSLGYPPNLQFTSHNLIVASNGISDIFVFLELDGKEWLEMLKIEILAENSENPGISLIEVRTDEKRENLHILAGKLENCEKTGKWRTRIYWITVGLEDLDLAENLTIKSRREILQYGNFETCTIDENLKNLLIFSSETPKFSGNLDAEIESEKSMDFQQNGRKIEVNFEVLDEILEENVKFNISKKSIFLAVNNSILLEGTLFGEIDENSVEICADPKNHKISLKIEKIEDLKWDELLEKSGNSEKKIEKKGFGQKIDKSEDEEKICGGIDEYSEECDESENAQFLWILDVEKLKILKNFDLTGHQILFIRRDNLKPAEICLRFDVDGIIWKFSAQNPEHLATLQAFGYVQASKIQRIWSGCSDDFKFGAIVEANRILVYSQNVAVDGNLVNRKTSSKNHTYLQTTSDST
ncbi:unnamed protein product [Caenorhabditis angaria]|uniref:NudC domain-containing protein 1 n=1 Tax=Caenorhabditis angaria TaxID=860376 RepID=A0A9P1MUW9_9PELO|nr:unnamed protein product [Caenorhabditis angaria]